MNKNTAKTLLANAAKARGLKVQMRAGKTADDVRVLNASTGKVVAEGTIKLDNTGYVSADVRKTVNQINVKLGKSKMNSSRRRKMNASREYRYPDTDYNTVRTALIGSDDGYEYIYQWYKDYLKAYGDRTNQSIDTNSDFVFDDFCKYMEDSETESEFRDNLTELFELWGNTNASRKKANASKRRRMNAGCHSKRKMNASDDDYAGEDAEFVDDVESIVVDDAGNEIVVDEMLVVQNPETNEISLFVPTEGDDEVPADVEVIGEVSSADDTVLDSSRKRRK